MYMLYPNTMPFYIRDLSIYRFLYLWRVLEPIYWGSTVLPSWSEREADFKGQCFLSDCTFGNPTVLWSKRNKPVIPQKQNKTNQEDSGLIQCGLWSRHWESGSVCDLLLSLPHFPYVTESETEPREVNSSAPQAGGGHRISLPPV